MSGSDYATEYHNNLRSLFLGRGGTLASGFNKSRWESGFNPKDP